MDPQCVPVEDFGESLPQIVKYAWPLANEMVRMILHWQRVLAGIHEEIKENLEHPFEQDLIYEAVYGSKPAEGRKIQVDGVEIVARILHRTGKRQRDIRGADLLYEIENEKFVLVQFKRADEKGRVHGEAEQLAELLEQCPAVCFYKRKPSPVLPPRLNGFCGVWYRVDVPHLKNAYFVHGCESLQIFAKGEGKNFSEMASHAQKSVPAGQFERGLDQDMFLRLFAMCRLGAIVRIKKPSRYIETLQEQQHLIFHILQRGRFSKEK